MVMCDCYKPGQSYHFYILKLSDATLTHLSSDGTPIIQNTRIAAAKIVEAAAAEEPWFGCEQEVRPSFFGIPNCQKREFRIPAEERFQYKYK